MLLKKNIDELLRQYQEKNMSNAAILRIALDTRSQLHAYLQPNFDEQFDNFLECLLSDYEIDEFEEYEKIGLSNHPYLLENTERYQPSFICFDFRHEDFLGSIWMPYTSKPNYEANFSFRYDSEDRSISTGISRNDELDKTPQWFQDLFTSCREYIQQRNNDIFTSYEERFNELYEQLGEFNYALFDSQEQDNPIARQIFNEGVYYMPLIIRKLETTDDERLCELLHGHYEFDWHYDAHGEEDKLKEYRKIKENFDTFKEYWLEFGKRKEWI